MESLRRARRIATGGLVLAAAALGAPATGVAAPACTEFDATMEREGFDFNPAGDAEQQTWITPLAEGKLLQLSTSVRLSFNTYTQRISIYDPKAGKLVAALPENEWIVEISANGTRLLTRVADSDGPEAQFNYGLWDLRTGQREVLKLPQKINKISKEKLIGGDLGRWDSEKTPRFVGAGSDGSIAQYSLDGKELERTPSLDKEGSFRDAHFSPDHRFVILEVPPELPEGVAAGPEPVPMPSASPSPGQGGYYPDPRMTLTPTPIASARPKAHLLVDRATGKVLEQWPGEELLSFSPKGRWAVFRDGQTVTYRNLGTGKSRKLVMSETVPGHYYTGTFAPDEETVVYGSKIVFLSTGQEYPVTIPPGAPLTFAPDGKKVFFNSDASHSAVVSLDLATGGRREYRLPVNRYDSRIAVSPDGKKLATIVYGNTSEADYMQRLRAAVLDLETGKWSLSRSKTSQMPYFLSNDELLIQVGNSYRRFKPAQGCFDRTRKIARGGKECPGCGPTEARFHAPLAPLVDDMEAIQNLCKEPYNAEKWAPLAALPAAGEIPRDVAKNALRELQKPDAFVASRHLPLLMAVMKSELPREEPDLVQGALESVFASSSGVYLRLLELYPYAARIEGRGERCRTDEEDAMIRGAVRSYLLAQMKANPESTMETWEPYLPLRRQLAQLPEAQKEELRDGIAQSLADKAAKDPVLENVFISKLYKLAYQAVAPVFGEKIKPVTDLTVIRQPKRDLYGNARGELDMRPVIVGTEALDGDERTKTAYGFYARRLPAIDTAQALLKPLAQQVTWQHGQKIYHADIRVDKGQAKQVIPEGQGPRYDEIWADGKLNGLIITGANFDSDAKRTLDEYLVYFQREARYTFEPEPRVIEDVYEFMKKGMSSGEFDYLIKEAHSDGDNRNLFRMHRKGKARVGKRVRPDGKTETVYLVYPPDRYGEQLHLSNDDFGAWMRAREEKKLGQLVYFNMSCWSVQKAIHEVEAAQTPVFLNIPTTQVAQAFGWYQSNAMYNLLHAFRQGQDFNGLRQALRKDPYYVARTKNTYIFPDEPEYKQKLQMALKVVYQTKLQVEDEAGKLHNIDDQH